MYTVKSLKLALFFTLFLLTGYAPAYAMDAESEPPKNKKVTKKQKNIRSQKKEENKNNQDLTLNLADLYNSLLTNQSAIDAALGSLKAPPPTNASLKRETAKRTKIIKRKKKDNHLKN